MNDTNSPNTPRKLIDIRAFENCGDLQLINGYGENGFRVSGEHHSGSIMLTPRKTLAWQPPENANDLTIDHIFSYVGTEVPPLFILGVGKAPMAPIDHLTTALKNEGIAMELMSTAAACRTWNVLMSEGRGAAAGLYAVT